MTNNGDQENTKGVDVLLAHQVIKNSLYRAHDLVECLASVKQADHIRMFDATNGEGGCCFFGIGD